MLLLAHTGLTCAQGVASGDNLLIGISMNGQKWYSDANFVPDPEVSVLDKLTVTHENWPF